MLKLIPIWSHSKASDARSCQEHCRTHHAHLASSEPEMNRNFAKYVLNFVIDRPGFTGAERFAGISEDWFFSQDAFTDAFASSVYPKFREDELRFVDFSQTILVACNAAHIFGRHTESGYKMFRLRWYRPDVDVAKVRKIWELEYARAMIGSAAARSLATAYVQNRPVAFEHSFPAAPATCDALDEFWFDSLEALEAFQAVESTIAMSVGIDNVFDAERQVQLAASTMLLWDFGEDPALGLMRLGADKAARQG